jgi:hypothetical protein
VAHAERFVGNLAHADPLASSLTKAQLNDLSRLFKVPSHLMRSVGRFEDPLKSTNGLVVQRDKEAKTSLESSKLALQGIDKGLQATAAGSRTEIAAVFGGLAGIVMDSVTSMNKVRLATRESRATMAAIDAKETEPVLRDSQRKQLEKRAKEEEQKRAL